MNAADVKYSVRGNNIFRSLINIIIVVTIAYNSGSAISTSNNLIGFVLMIISIFGIFLIYMEVSPKFKISYINIYFLIMILMVLNSLVVNRDLRFIDGNIRYIVIILFSFVIVKNVKQEVFIVYYTKIMSLLVVISLIPFYLVNTHQIDLMRYMPIFENGNGVQYYNGVLFYFYTYSQRRNMGIFWEPSIFSNFILIAMFYEIAYKKTSMRRLLILFLGLLSTGSTAAFFLFPFIIMIYVFRRTNHFEKLFYQTVFLFSGLWAYVNIDKIIIFLAEKFPPVFGKLINENSSSLLDRSNSPIANIELFLNNPIFGHGLGRVDEMYSSYLITQTSTSTYYLAAFGIFGILYSATIIYGAYNQKHLNLTTRILMATLLMIIVNKEPQASIVLTHIIIFYLVKPVKVFNEKVSDYRLGSLI